MVVNVRQLRPCPLRRKELNGAVWTCQDSTNNGCDFFLWVDQARLRQNPFAPGGGRSISDGTMAAPTTPFSAKRRQQPLTPNSFHRPDRTKYQFTDVTCLRGDSPGELGEWPNSDDEALAQVAEKVEALAPPRPPETPRKAIKTSATGSPRQQRPGAWASDDDEDSFVDAEDGIARSSDGWGDTASLMSPAYTPTPVRTRLEYPELLQTPTPSEKRPPRPAFATSQKNPLEASPFLQSSPFPNLSPLLATPSSGGDPAASAVGSEVLNLLRNLNVDLTEEIVHHVQELGTKFDRKLRAVEMGREVSRDAVKRRDAKLATQAKDVEQRDVEIGKQREIITSLRRRRDELAMQLGVVP